LASELFNILTGAAPDMITIPSKTNDQTAITATIMDNITSKMSAISLSGSVSNEDESAFCRGLYRYLVFVTANDGTDNIRSKADDQLKAWITEQDKLRQKQKTQVGNSKLTTERIMVLDKVQFPWRLDNAERWTRNYNELVKFHAVHHHCNVPRKGELSSLGQWVNQQRRLKRQHADGTRNSLTMDRVALLDALNFQWDFLRG